MKNFEVEITMSNGSKMVQAFDTELQATAAAERVKMMWHDYPGLAGKEVRVVRVVWN